MKIHSGQTSESKTSTCQTGGIIMHLGRFIQNEWGHSQGLGHRRQGPTSIAKQGAGHSKQKRPRQKANKKVSSRGGAQHARFWAQNEFQMPCTGRNGAPILYSDPLLFDHGFADGRCLVGLKQLGRSSCRDPLWGDFYHQVADSLIDLDCLLQIIFFSAFWTLRWDPLVTNY